jgi:hypothetical protein
LFAGDSPIGRLLIGGRLADLFGRTSRFITGPIGFSVASAIGGSPSRS